MGLGLRLGSHRRRVGLFDVDCWGGMTATGGICRGDVAETIRLYSGLRR
jgi:hypothetical protein